MDNREFIRLQIEEIKKHRWIMSEKAGTDLSWLAEQDWVEKHAKLYREHIEKTYGPIILNKCTTTVAPV